MAHAATVGIERVNNDPASLAGRFATEGGIWLIWGPPGVGKSTLAAELAARLERKKIRCHCIAADPGSPGFGVPGAVALGVWENGGWLVNRLMPLCSLDAIRYRLPLVMALRELAAGGGADRLLVDAPGAVRGTAAVELLTAMLDAAGVDRVVAILPESGAEADAARTALESTSIPVLLMSPSPLSRRPTKKQRARSRTKQWDVWLERSTEETLDLGSVSMTGGVLRESLRWEGRQVALLDSRGRPYALGEVLAGDGEKLQARMLRLWRGEHEPSALLVRDAARAGDGLLSTARQPGGLAAEASPPPDLTSPEGEGADPACFVHMGNASALLVNGLFGDPLLHIRLRQRRRSLLFDLGDSGRLPAKIAHQVSDVFISHAHMDHIGGFLWFLRSRLGETEPCRLYGPPGLSDHIFSFIGGIRWDRIGERGPRFEVLELHGERVLRSRIQVGRAVERLDWHSVADGCLLAEPEFRVRAVTLDHGIPVLAFVFEAAPVVHIRKDRLMASGLPEGPWVGALKHRIAEGRSSEEMLLPDGRRYIAADLADDLVERDPARRLVYATDLADTPENRLCLTGLAKGADVLICEAGFTSADAEQASRTGHLTARACGEIAAEAGVSRLVPFHFSRRYEDDLEDLYAEVQAGFPGLVLRSRGRRDD